MDKARRDKLRALATAAISKDEWGKDRTALEAIDNSRGDGYNAGHDADALVLYDDGDWCAEVYDNLGMGIEGIRMAELFAACDPKSILSLLDEMDRLEARASGT